MIGEFRDWLRGGAALMAVVYLVGYLGAFLHTTMEVHVVCAEHGDLIHLDEEHAQVEQVDAPPLQTQISGTETHDDHHQHCALAQLLRSAQGEATSIAVVPAARFVVATILEPDALSTPIRGPTVRLFLLAPKTSPPIA